MDLIDGPKGWIFPVQMCLWQREDNKEVIEGWYGLKLKFKLDDLKINDGFDIYDFLNLEKKKLLLLTEFNKILSVMFWLVSPSSSNNKKNHDMWGK